jgi:hypothetical protein
MLKKILTGLLVILVVIQFFRPERNISNDKTYDIAKKYDVPKEVDRLLEVSCNDCHSNKTVYPWYANIQPVAWWLDEHIEDGKRHLNFSEFTKRPLYVQNHKLEEIIEMVDDGEMPLASYTNFGLHPEANLTLEQRNQITAWAKAQMAYLKDAYPADSLAFPKRD